MDAERLMEFAGLLGLERAKIRAGNLVCSCPFASTRHIKADGTVGKDRHPSFGIRIEPAGESLYNCFSCASSGDLTYLCFELERLRGSSHQDAIDFVFDNEIADGLERSEKDPKAQAPGKKRVDVQRDLAEDVVDDDVLLNYPGIPAYAAERGVTPEAQVAWEIGDDPKEGRMILPVRRFDGKLVGVYGRTYRDAPEKYYPYVPIHRGRYFYGEHQLKTRPADKPIVIVEGQIDAIKVWQAGWPVLALMGGLCTGDQKRKLRLLERPLLLMPDPNETGRRWAKRLGLDLKNEVAVYDVPMRDLRDPGDLNTTEIESRILEATLRL